MVTTSILDGKFPPTFIGFEALWNEADRLKRNTDNFPRHNVVRHSEDNLSIELALAGYTADDIEVEVKDGSLHVRGVMPEDDRDYAFKGISTKKFERSFKLAEHVIVTGADFVNGLLVIDLKVELPEEKKPRLIPIGTERQLLTED